jgi:hypothetical protein
MDEQPTHPVYGKALNNGRKLAGITFRPYRIPGRAGDTTLVSDDRRIEIRMRSWQHNTYVCLIDGKPVRSSGDPDKHRYFHAQVNAAQYAAGALAQAAEYATPTPTPTEERSKTDMSFTDEDKRCIQQFLKIINEVGRQAAEYLDAELAKEENEEASAWIEVTK